MMRKTPGPAPTVTRELLLAAGCRCLSSSGARQPHRLSDLLGVRLGDVLEATAELLQEQGVPTAGRRMSTSSFYKYWSNFNDYLRDLIGSAFSPSGLHESPLLQPSGDLARAVRDHAVQDRRQAAHPTQAIYFGCFRGAADEEVRLALESVYKGYDDVVVPVLTSALRASGRRPRTVAGVRMTVAQIAAALTALTEGLTLRQIVQPDLVGPDELWASAAESLLYGLTEEDTADP